MAHRRSRARRAALLVLGMVCGVARAAWAQGQPPAEPAPPPPPAEPAPPERDDETTLVKKAQNPLSDLVLVTLQNNVNFGAGPESRRQNVLNVQPTARAWLGKHWLIVNRAQLPVIDQPLPLGRRIFGLSDLLLTFFLSPRELLGPFVWGVGPSLVLPTATERVLGAGKWAVGPSVAAMTTQGPWVLGGLAIQTWSVAGDGERAPTSNLLVQPIVTYAFGKTWSFGTTPIITADWRRPPTDRWTLPLGPTVAKMFAVAGARFQLSTSWFWNVVRPDDTAEVQLRLQLSIFILG